MDWLMNRLLRRYEGESLVMKLKARFMLYISFSFLFVFAVAALYSWHIELNDPNYGYSIDVRIMIALIAGIVCNVAGILVIVRGRYAFGAHFILLCGFTTVWMVMAVDKSFILSRLNTALFLVVLLSLVPVATTRKPSVFVAYPLVNSALFCLYLWYFRYELGLAYGPLIDHIADSLLSIVGAAIIGYNIFSINKKALEHAEQEVFFRRNTEELLAQKSYELGERVKELDCLHTVSALLERPGINEKDIFQGVADILPSAYQYSDLSCARITFGGVSYQTENFADTPWKQERKVSVQGVSLGSVEVRYLQELPKMYEGPFLKEEGMLLNTVAERLGRVVERMRAEEALREGEENYRGIFENASMGIFHSLPSGTFLRVNGAFASILGFSGPEEMISSVKNISSQIYADPLRRDEVIERAFRFDGWKHYEMPFKRKDGTVIITNLTVRGVDDKNGNPAYLEGFVVDITESKKAGEALKLNEMRLNALLTLSEKTHGLSEAEIVQASLEEAQNLTGSPIGYFHFINDDGETIQLAAWSQSARKQCTAEEPQHYLLSVAGVWADCARTKKPAVHNDYPALEGKHELPRGHSELVRHMSVPVIEGDEVKAIAGVANKATEYEEADVRQLQLLANDTWRIVRRKRAEEESQKLAAIIETSSDFIGISDLEGRVLYVNEAGLRLVGIDSLSAVKGKYIGDFLAPEEAVRLTGGMVSSIKESGSWVGEFKMIHTASGRPVPVEMNAFIIRSPETGKPMAFAGISRDISERKRAELALFELATSDPLTGVYNRRRFFELAGRAFKHALLKSQELSALMIDVDHFKAINDKYGHAVGDQILAKLVTRLRAGLRDSDILGRYGGEEFVVLMPGTDRTSALRVAGRLLDEVRRDPVNTGRKTIPVTVSIGIAVLEEGRDLTTDDLINRADEAMYRAKHDGRNCVREWTPGTGMGI